MQVDMINKIYSTSQLGVRKCLRRARDIVFRTGMNGQIKESVAKCVKSVLSLGTRKQKYIWNHMKYLYGRGKFFELIFLMDSEHYIVLVDSYSKFFAVSKLTNTWHCWKWPMLGTAGTEKYTYRRSRFTNQLIIGRRTRTVLPVKPSLVTPDKLKVDVLSV